MQPSSPAISTTGEGKSRKKEHTVTEVGEETAETGNEKREGGKRCEENDSNWGCHLCLTRSLHISIIVNPFACKQWLPSPRQAIKKEKIRGNRQMAALVDTEVEDIKLKGDKEKHWARKLSWREMA